MPISDSSVSETTLTERRRWLLGGIPLTRTRYILNTETLQRSHGVISPVKTTVDRTTVRGVALQQSRLQKRFGLATVRVATNDPLVSELVLHNIRNGELFEGRLRRWAEDSQNAQPHTL